MKRLGTVIVLSMVVALVACGGVSNNETIKGNWAAALYNPDGTTALIVTATLTQSGTTVNVAKFSFTTPSSCFASGTTASGVFTPTGTTHGVTSGTLQMAFQSGPSNPNGMNLLGLQGTFVRNVISGTWNLTGTGLGCAGPENLTSGNFTMSQR
ncbi:MAG: hypothetical protein WB952_08235 [Terriglobales bacterium]